MNDTGRNRSCLHHDRDYFIEYMNGNKYSAQWMHDVDNNDDWYDPHWKPEIPRSRYNIFCYRYFGKLPWVKWQNHIISFIITGIPCLICKGLINRR